MLGAIPPHLTGLGVNRGMDAKLPVAGNSAADPHGSPKQVSVKLGYPCPVARGASTMLEWTAEIIPAANAACTT